MDRQQAMSSISGCYIPIPTLFRDSDLEVNLQGMRRHVRFLLDGGVRQGNGVILVGGGAGEFHVLNTDERLRCAQAVIDEAADKLGVIVGVQSTDPRESMTLARAARNMGAVAVQAAAPFYHVPTEDDLFEYLSELHAASDIPIVFYTTYWTGFHTSREFLGRLVEAPGIVGIKWATPGTVAFERGLRTYSSRVCMIDNQLSFVLSHMLGARGFNTHPSNYYPQWGVRFWELLESRQYEQAQAEMTRVVMPYYDMHEQIGRFTGGEGHLDKLCLELVGLETSRCRPPVRDIRDAFRERVRRMLRDSGVPGCA